MTIAEITDKLDAAKINYSIWKDSRVYIKSTPNGGRGDYGYLVEGDDGSTGTCSHISRRKGEIAEALRA